MKRKVEFVQKSQERMKHLKTNAQRRQQEMRHRQRQQRRAGEEMKKDLSRGHSGPQGDTTAAMVLKGVMGVAKKGNWQGTAMFSSSTRHEEGE